MSDPNRGSEGSRIQGFEGSESDRLLLGDEFVIWNLFEFCNLIFEIYIFSQSVEGKKYCLAKIPFYCFTRSPM